MRLAILFLFLVACSVRACPSGKRTARDTFGDDVQCVASSDDLAYCTVNGRAFMCDKEACVQAPDTTKAMLELDTDRARKDEERRQAEQSITTTP